MAGKAACTLLHLGVGLANGSANLHNARRAGAPVVNLVGDMASWHVAKDPLLASDIEGLASFTGCFYRASGADPDGLSDDVADALVAACGAALKTSNAALFVGGAGLCDEEALRACSAIAAATGCALVVENAFASTRRKPAAVVRVPYFPRARTYLAKFETVVFVGARKPVAMFGYDDGVSDLVGLDGQTVLEIDAMGVPGAPPADAIVVDESLTSGGSYWDLSLGCAPFSHLTLTGGSIGIGPPLSVGCAVACPGRRVVDFQADGSGLYSTPAFWTMAAENLDVTVLVCKNDVYQILKVEQQKQNLPTAKPNAKKHTNLSGPSVDWPSSIARTDVRGSTSRRINSMSAPSERTHVDRKAATAAYSALDVELSSKAHAERASGTHDEQHSAVGGRLKTIVFGGLDGILTCFAIVSSCAGSDMSPRVVLLLGACNILADALAMGVGEYLSTKSSDEFASYERTREDWEMRHNPEGEILEMVDIYVGRGMSREDATTVITTMAKYHDFFVNVMMVEELGLTVPEPEAHCDAMKDGFLMFLAFCVLALSAPRLRAPPAVPARRGAHELFLAACAVTGVTLFGLGAVKAKFVNGNPRLAEAARSALCASSAYSAGALLQQFLPS
ncbi:hypothetical protein JL722_345 [Aureococcus anophagefferens]|nr:hypothetical protein JL722_345 [Aureococcus anophagefferens]